MRKTRYGIFVLALFAHMAPAHLGAQTIVGQLIDDETDAAIRDATVTLLDVRNRIVAGTLTDSGGTFHLEAAQAGEYFVKAERIGYKLGNSRFLTLLPTDTVAIEFRLSTEAVLLAPITVTATTRDLRQRSGSPARWGFYERREIYGKLGFGRFLTREDLDPFRSMPLWMIISRYPGVYVASVQRFVGVAVPQGAGPSDSPIATTFEYQPIGEEANRNREVMLRGALGTGCRPKYFVDGAHFPLLDGETIDHHVQVSNLEGVEVYVGASQIPAEFAGFDAQCGVIAVWTDQRHGR